MNYEKIIKKELIEKLKEKEGKVETKKEAIKIKNRYNGEVIYESKMATTIKEAVEEAVKSKADLSWANLSKADLTWADLSGADLSKADLTWADLSGADLSEANLTGADYWKTNLWKVKLTKKTKEQLEKIIGWEVKD